MGESKIQWTDITWNPVTGCTRVSPGCDHCYASTLHNQRFKANVKAALGEIGDDDWQGPPAVEMVAIARRRDSEREEWPEWKGLPFPATYDTPFAWVTLHPERLDQPLRRRSWRGKRVFVNSMSDLFHEDVPFEFMDRVFAVMAETPDITYQVLTKRPERMRQYMNRETQFPLGVEEARMVMRRADLPIATEWPLPNVWLGVSVEDQERADERIPVLLGTPAAVRFISCEPLLGAVDLCACEPDYRSEVCPLHGRWELALDWVIVGGESGPKARPFDIAWARSLRDQCRAAGVAYFLKQLGRRPREHYRDRSRWPVDLRWVGTDDVPEVSAPDRDPDWWAPVLRDSHGGDWDEWPEDLRVREFPAT